ncbi:hypothetical protein C8039_06575 [Halogeometricum sp. wsp3]|nr:hypothetical protein C8039_06575 [Halogeometricum sp. wsp3]
MNFDPETSKGLNVIGEKGDTEVTVGAYLIATLTSGVEWNRSEPNVLISVQATRRYGMKR